MCGQDVTSTGFANLLGRVLCQKRCLQVSCFKLSLLEVYWQVSIEAACRQALNCGFPSVDGAGQALARFQARRSALQFPVPIFFLSFCIFRSPQQTILPQMISWRLANVAGAIGATTSRFEEFEEAF